MSKHRVRRSHFTDEEIQGCWKLAEGNQTDCARLLTDLGRGPVSLQACRYWLKALGLIKSAVVNDNAVAGPRILSIDIETAPIEAAVWSLWKQNIGLKFIRRDWFLLSFCAKWLGDDTIIYEDLEHEEELDDSNLVAKLYALLNEADIVIGQNGKAFDVPKIQARFIQQGYLPPRPFKVVDTMLMAKQVARFTSNKLEWLTAILCTEQKRQHEKFPGVELWNQCLLRNPEAWAEMKAYNIADVTSMEELYLKLRPWYVGHPNVSIYYDDDVCRCPKCGSEDVKQDGWFFTNSGKYEAMHCGGCGGWSRGRYTKNSIAVRKAQLSN